MTARPNFVRRFPLVSYFVIALAISWIVVLAHVLPDPDLPTTWVTIVCITAGPFVAAFTVQAIVNGRAGILRLLRGLVRVRVSWVWYVVVLLGIPAVLVAGTVVLPGALASMDVSMQAVPGGWASYLWNFPLVLLVGGPLLEEPGWRGFALPRLETRFGQWGPIVGTLVLGVIWALWHFPQYMMPAWAAQNGGVDLPAMLVYIASVLPIAVLLTWIYNRTRGSLFMTVLAHTSINAFSIYIGPMFPAQAGSLVNGFVGFGGAALLIVLFTRGRLGFDHYLRETSARDLALDGVTATAVTVSVSRSHA
ncbi:CPBP family intramembrane metalloprotease [Agromyces protaetiae]|uniref:CPBP family intramembrane metalloprotease n=1 Tax=Agromyces protaetiae TaxID=2509455 RepID=A0A4P6FEZ3_9MICO|nr:type II CAAX endopeptidase family protein [Agromyces protaetiae]QAY73613.1 CPBP family intramembrane metalloprotease [Agromyces protaetiae]